MGGIDEEIFLFLILIDVGTPEGEVGAMIGEGGNPLIEAQLGIGAANPRFVVLPIVTLAPAEDLQCNALVGVPCHVRSPDAIVDAQRAFLVGAEDEARAKLLVEVTEGDGTILPASTGVEVCQSPPLEISLVARQGELVPLQTGTGIDVATLETQVGIGIGQGPFVVLPGTDGLVLLRHEDVRLDAAAEGGTVTLFFLSHGSRRGRQTRREQQIVNSLHRS